MMSSSIRRRRVALQAYELFPASIQNTLLSDRDFRREYDLTTSAVLTFNGSGAKFARKDLFAVIRNLYADTNRTLTIHGNDGQVWTATAERVDDELKISLTGNELGLILPEYWYFDPDATKRMAALDRVSRDANLFDDPLFAPWRDVLVAGPLDDEDVNDFQHDLGQNPLYIARALEEGFENGETPTDVIVPEEVTYYERLVGVYSNQSTPAELLNGSLPAHYRSLLAWDHERGLAFALLLSAHSSFAKTIDISGIERATILEAFEWLSLEADRLSQVGGFELGISILPEFPEIEPHLLTIARAIMSDDPQDKNGRLSLLSTVFVFVEGTIAAAGTLRGRPPFWRRLASLAQASLIERQFVSNGLDGSAVADWAAMGRGHFFYMRTFLDMRLESRWLPDFASPEQFKAEFVSRIVGAAVHGDASLYSPELKELLLHDNAQGGSELLKFPQSFMPGPLEGANDSLIDPPEWVAEAIRKGLEEPKLSPNSFAVLVNSSLVFTMNPENARLAAEALRRAKYILREGSREGQEFHLLSGLAILAAATRSAELAVEVRILARVLRRRAPSLMSTADFLRIGLIAAASHQDIREWSTFFGDWAAELAFEDMNADDARTMSLYLSRLCQLEPQLYRTCGRAIAAVESMVGRAE